MCVQLLKYNMPILYSIKPTVDQLGRYASSHVQAPPVQKFWIRPCKYICCKTNNSFYRGVLWGGGLFSVLKTKIVLFHACKIALLCPEIKNWTVLYFPKNPIPFYIGTIYTHFCTFLNQNLGKGTKLLLC